MVGSHHLFPLSSLPAAWVFLSLCHARVREFAHGRPQTLTHTRREKIAEKMKGGVEKYGWPCSGGRRDFLQVPHFDCTPHPSFSYKNLLHFLLTTSLFQTSSKRFLPPLQKTLGLLCFICPFSPGCPHAAVPAAGDDPIRA